jgi:plastocyanin
MRFTIRPERTALILVAAAIACGSMAAALAQSTSVISQKGRQFRPGEVTIAKGASITVVNDDGDLRHHAYIDADAFKFDSGDQEPGSRTVITFPAAGDFDVLCAIHPKMKLTVHVK